MGFSKFEDHLNMLIKMTKIANPAGDLVQMRYRLETICEAQMIAVRNSITVGDLGSHENVRRQMIFLDRCSEFINITFAVDSTRWQIGYVEIC